MPKFLTPLRMGNPLLTQISTPVDNPLDPDIQTIIEDMMHTIQNINERIGLAAPQVGILKRIVVYRIPATSVNPRYNNIAQDDQEEVPWTVLINPVITPICHDTKKGWEGCISVPGLMGEVERYTHIHFTALNEKGEKVERTVSGFHALVIQHECDHLDGILFPMPIYKKMCLFL